MKKNKLKRRESKTPATTDNAIIKRSTLFQQGEIETEIIPQVDFKSLLEKATKNIGGRLGIISEPVWNSEDAEATNIWVFVENEGDKDKYSITFLDNGRGMGPKGRQAFVDVAKSHFKEQKFKRGRHGLGVKRMMADFQYCEAVDISAEEKDGMRVMSFSWDDWLERVEGNKDIHLFVKKNPRNPCSIGLPKDSTGVYIRLWGPRGQYYTINEVVDTLATYLAPWVTKKVLVSNDGRTWTPLKTREFVGEQIEFEENHPILGRIIVNIYLPKSVTEGDALRIGAIGPVCDYRDFKSYLPAHLKKSLSDVFDNPIVNGIIDVARFNEFSDAYRKSFDVSLFETPLMEEFVHFLDYTLADKVAERLGWVEAAVEDEYQRRLMEEVAELCSVLDDEKIGPKPSPEHPLVLTVKNIEVLRGQKVNISVRRHSTTIKNFSWDASMAGGSVDTEEGKQVIYTAGDKVGEYELVCFDADNPDTRSGVKISIVPKFQLRISPSQVTLEMGESITLHAKNVEEDTSGAANLRWRTDEPEGKFDATRGDMVTYTAGYQEDTYTVTVYDRQKTTKQATAYVTVVKEKPERKPAEDDVHIIIEGRKYKLKARGVAGSSMLSWKSGDKTSKYVEIHVNWAHLALQQARKESKSACRQILIRQVLLTHLDLISEEFTSVEQINNKMAMLHEKIAKKMIEKEE